jgi:hypothetical protein
MSPGRLRCLSLLLLAGACVAPELEPSPLTRSFTDETPAYVTPGALDCVVPILVDHGSDGLSLGSGVVIAPDVLLTAAHVVDASVAGGAPVTVVVDGVSTKATLLGAAGREEPHGDWALLQLEDVVTAPPALIYGPARDPGWEPAPGTEVLLAGYALGFFGSTGDQEISIPPDAPTPCVRAAIEAGGGASCWLAATAPVYLGGISGGAAMIWNLEAQRAEVIGLVTSFLPTLTTRRTTRTVRIPGGAPRVLTSEIRTVPYQLRRLPPLVTRPEAQ